jgi:hypothetical protein
MFQRSRRILDHRQRTYVENGRPTVENQPKEGTAQIAAEISFKPWLIQSARSVSRLIKKSCGSVGVTKKTLVIFDGYGRRKGLTYLVDMCTGKVPNSLSFESWLTPEA